MSIKLNGATSGSVELDVPDAIGSDLNVTLPATAGEIVVANTSGDVDLGGLTVSGSAADDSVNIDSSGRLLVGTSSDSGVGLLIIQGYSGSSTGEGIVSLQKGAATPASGDSLGVINFANNGANNAAQVFAQRDGGTWTSGSSHPGRLVFSTTADGASSPTERMQITKAGSIRSYNVGTTEANLVCVNDGSSPNSIIYFQTSSVELGKIYRGSGNTVVYSTSSDYRLKENVTLIADGIERVKQLKPSRFNWISEPDKRVDGFIAHEVQPVVPDAVAGEKDAVDDEGNIKPQSLSTPCLIPLLTAALQEAIAKIETLEAKVAALEANP